MNVLWITAAIAAVALLFAAYNFRTVKKQDEGTEKMREIASAIRIGANAFINYEYRVLLIVAVILAVLLGAIFKWYVGVAFILGAFMSASAGWIGMKIATYANVRVSNTAKLTKNIGKTLKIAFCGGSVMGLCVAGFSILGFFIIYIAFGMGMGMLNEENICMYQNQIGISFVPFSQTVSGYALGCSVVAIFNRIGGGIYTKAADMGADIVGKNEADIAEDDPRNPATIADNVGDNVGDVAGLGSDLLESFVGSVVSVIMLSFNFYLTSQYTNGRFSAELLRKMYMYPLIFVAIGLASCCIGIGTLLLRKNISDNPHRSLNLSTWISAGLTLLLNFGATVWFFSKEDISGSGFRIGYLSPWVGGTVGVLVGIAIGMTAELYTSSDYKPTKELAKASKGGPAFTVTEGFSLGMRSCMLPGILLGVGVLASYYFSGLYGVAMAAVGMLSFVATTVSVDTYGPIADNAGGIAEMSDLDPKVREITDVLDAVGNTTAAIGKGFAVGSGALAALALMISYLYSYNSPDTELILNLIDPLTLGGTIIGSALPFLFSGRLIEAVTKTAQKMVKEVRRQFREYPGILSGEELPDYKTCIEISTKGALKETKIPAFMAVIVPIACGFVFGPEFVGGILIGSTLSAIMIAIFAGNAGGAWDNGKKYIESGAIDGSGKGSDAHKASVVGDTVGDPLKDTVGPCLNIFIKIMSTVSLIAVPAFSKYNLLNLLNINL